LSRLPYYRGIFLCKKNVGNELVFIFSFFFFARTLQQVYDILSSTSSLQALMAQLPGCTNISLVGMSSDPNAYPTFQEIADAGQNTYSDEKVNFLVSLIVILVVSVVVLVGGHLFTASRMEEREMTQEYGTQG
jgi:hypothetical protein